jgi:hypothetical protein
MIELAAAATIARLVSDAVGSLDKIFRGYADFVKREERAVGDAPPPDYAYQDSPGDKAIVARSRDTGQVYQTVTYQELATRLGPQDLKYIRDLCEVMEAYQAQWSRVFKQKPLAGLGLESARLDGQLDHLARQISETLKNILSFVERTGLHLDDHYHVARQIADQYLIDRRDMTD